MKNFLIATGLIFGLATAPMAPAPANAGGLADLFLGLSIDEGCSQFIGPDGFPVTVRHFLPNSACPSPAVIILHGSDGGTRFGKDYEEIGKGLAAKGYAAFMVYYYDGEPRAPRPTACDRGLPDPAAFLPWELTAEQAVGYVQSYPGVDPARVGILGMSLGGFIGTSVASNDPRVRSLVVLSGGMPDEWAKDMRTMPPTLIVHGDHDPDVPVTEAYKLHQNMASKGLWNDLEILPCEQHLPYHLYKDRVAEMVLDFFNRTL